MDAEIARRLFRYDPDSGALYWNARVSQRVKPGDHAGTPDGHGYLSVRANSKNHKVHRVIWMMIHSAPPNGMIDHINGNRSDNRIKNLRDVTPQENAQNIRAAHRDSKSGMLGVSPYKGKWAAQIMHAGKLRRIGIFLSAQEASHAYQEAKQTTHIYGPGA